MSEQTQAFFHHYRAMDTRILLARYHRGGLLPEAEAALLEVLATRLRRGSVGKPKRGWDRDATR